MLKNTLFAALFVVVKSAPGHLYTSIHDGSSGGQSGGSYGGGGGGFSLGSYSGGLGHGWAGGLGGQTAAISIGSYSGGGGGGHGIGGQTQSGGKLEGGDYHHGVSIVGTQQGKGTSFDLTDQAGSNHGGTFGGSFISTGSHGKSGGYAHAHEGGEHELSDELIGKHYSDVLRASSDIGHGGYETSEGHGGSSSGGDSGFDHFASLKGLGASAGWASLGGHY